MPNSFRLCLKDLSLQVNLGCGEAERAIKQEVKLTVDIDFAKPPVVCSSDRLDDAVCYAKVANRLESLVTRTSFHTVEYLAHLCFEEVKKDLPQGGRLKLSVHKVCPPLEQSSGGVFFTIGESL